MVAITNVWSLHVSRLQQPDHCGLQPGSFVVSGRRGRAPSLTNQGMRVSGVMRVTD